MDNIIFHLALFIALELFEANWQKANTLYGLLENNYKVYKKNLILYFLLNTTFIYTIFLIFKYQAFYNSGQFLFWMSAIFIMKSLDILFKIILLQKIDNNISIEEYLPQDIKLNTPLRLFGVILYPTMFIFATYL